MCGETVFLFGVGWSRSFFACVGVTVGQLRHDNKGEAERGKDGCLRGRWVCNYNVGDVGGYAFTKMEHLISNIL